MKHVQRNSFTTSTPVLRYSEEPDSSTRNPPLARISNPAFWLLVFVLVLLAPASMLHAQQASGNARVGYVYPAGARRGSTTQVVVGGQFLDGVSQVYASGSGIQVTVKEHITPMTFQQISKVRDTIKELMDRRAATFGSTFGSGRTSADSRPSTQPAFTSDDAKLLMELREKLMTAVFRPAFPAISDRVVLDVTVANDAAFGRHELRLQAASGLTNSLAFYVGQLPEVSEIAAKPRAQATASVAGRQMTVKLPVMINGQILPGGVNRYQFNAYRGQSIVAAAAARALTPYLADAVPGWFQATLTLYDAKGNELAYDDDSRVDHDPLLHCVIPADGQYIIEIKDALYRGREDFVYRLALGELPCITSMFPLGAPAGSPATVDLIGWNLPLRTLCETFSDAQPTVRAMAIPAADALIPQRLSFATDNLPECLAQRPSADPAMAQAVNLPIIINGRIAVPDDCDVFRFEGKAGEKIVAEVNARRLGSPLDSILELTDASGKQLALNDDYDDKGAGLITHQADSYLTAALPGDGTYYLYLRDVQGQGGPEYAYRLRLSHPRPDFQLLLEPSSISVRAGESTTITAHAIRQDGFTGPIHLVMTDDSQGFRLASAIIPADQDKAQLKLFAPESSIDQPMRLHFEGRATIDGQEITRPVVPADNMMQAFAYWHLVPADEMLAVALAPRARPQMIGPGSIKLASTLTAKFIADQMNLTGERADKFTSAYVNQRLASFQQVRTAATSGKQGAAMAALADASKAMQGVLEANLDPQQAPKATELLGPMFGVIERDVAGLLGLNVPEAKVQQAMPILSRYVRTAKIQVYDPVFNGVLSRQDGVMKIHDLRVTTAKDLARIIGSDAATKWADQPAMAMQTPPPGQARPFNLTARPKPTTSSTK